jgi:hypothetical protein
MADEDLTIWLKALDGQWERCGSDRLAGIYPEAFQATANKRGSDTCRFVLARNPGAIHPDLSAFTPCRVFIAGVKVWSGRVKETPTQDGDDAQITVECQGMQYHLDDDQYERPYVHTRLSDWRDTRSFLGANLLANVVTPRAEASDGIIQIGWAKGDVVATTERVGVKLDLGPDASWKRIVVEWERNGAATTDFQLFARGSSGEEEDSTFLADAFGSMSLNGAASGTAAGTFGTASRYVTIFLYRNGAAATLAADFTVRIKSVKLFRDTAYESANASILKADTVLKDALNTATVLLSTDQSQIQAGTFDISDLVLDGAKTPGEVADAVNAYEDYLWMIDADDRPVFKPKPTAPLFEIGAWSGADFKDASSNSGENVYNKVRVEAEGPDGNKLREERWSQVTSPGAIDMAGFAQPANPSADVNLSNWTALALVRDTAFYDSAPASFKTSGGTSIDTQCTAVTQALSRGRRYAVVLAYDGTGLFDDNNPSPNSHVILSVLDPTGSTTFASKAFPRDLVTSWPTFTLDWVQPVAATGYVLKIAGGFNVGASFAFDSIRVGPVTSTLAGRRGFVRSKGLPVSSAMTPAGMRRVGDLWLADHVTTPLKGDLQITGQGGIRRVLGGQGVHPAHMLRYTNELLRLSHRIDPDSGGQGRNGTISSVSYDHDNRQALVSIDNERGNLERLLARYAVVVGG